MLERYYIRIPKIQQQLLYFFNGKLLSLSIDPAEDIVYNAGVEAAELTGARFKTSY